MTFHEKLREYLIDALKAHGLTLNQAKQAGWSDPRVRYVAGKLLATYPVSFHINFILEQLDLPEANGTQKASVARQELYGSDKGVNP